MSIWQNVPQNYFYYVEYLLRWYNICILTFILMATRNNWVNFFLVHDGFMAAIQMRNSNPYFANQPTNFQHIYSSTQCKNMNNHTVLKILYSTKWNIKNNSLGKCGLFNNGYMQFLAFTVKGFSATSWLQFFHSAENTSTRRQLETR